MKLHIKTFLHKLFIENWPRKLISLIIAIIVWLLVNQTLTTSRNFSMIPIRITNIPEGKTLDGIQASGRLMKKISLTLMGNKGLLDTLTPQDLEIVLDATNQPDDWMVTLQPQHIRSCNPSIDLANGITRVHNSPFVLKMSNLVTEKIPLIITQPVGQPPRGYQFLDIWPYRLSLSVSGPEEVIHRLKSKEQKLTFNLTQITKSQLDAIVQDGENAHQIISYPVPDAWKMVNLPLLSEQPIHIDDPNSNALRIDFLKCHLLPLPPSIPVSIFFPESTSAILNPETVHLQTGGLIQDANGITTLNMPLYANGVDHLFLQLVRNRIKLIIIATPLSDRDLLEWSIEFINPRQLEDVYVSTLMAESTDNPPSTLLPHQREEYLRNRFRSYMYHFQLFTADDMPLNLSARLHDHFIKVEESDAP